MEVFIMDDKEKKKVGSALFEKYIAKGQSVVDNARPASGHIGRESSNWAKTAKEGIEAGLNGHYVDFEEALAKGQTNIDPQTYTRATDGKEEKGGKPKPNRFIRDINERIKQAQEEVKTEKEAGLDENSNYREAKIAEKEKLIRDTMDRRGTNTISTKAFGYDVGLVRTGERGEFSIGKNGQPMFSEHKDSYEREDGTIVAGSAKAVPEPVELTINGKPVVVKPGLTGDAVSFEGRYPEISQDLAREGIAKMAADGTTKWAKEIGEGDAKHTVEVAMKGSAGRTQVMVDENLKGDQTARAGGMRVSEGFWDMAKGNMSVNGTYSYATTMPDGKTVICGIHVKVNGKPAMIDGWGGKDAMGEESIPSDKFQHALNQMKEHGTQNWAETLQDGTTIQVGISTQIDGDKRTALDWGNSKIEATVEPEKILVSKDAWMEAAESMLAGDGGKRSFEKTLADGTTVEFRMGARIDGHGAVIEENFGGREISQERDRVLVGKELFEEATREMTAKQSISAKAVDRDGNEVEFKRPGKIRMFVNGQEMNDSQYQEALAEVAGMNDEKEFATLATIASGAKEQIAIQTTRNIINTGMAAPGKAIKEGRQKNTNLLSQLLSMLFSTISRTSQSIGR